MTANFEISPDDTGDEDAEGFDEVAQELLGRLIGDLTVFGDQPGSLNWM